MPVTHRLRWRTAERKPRGKYSRVANGAAFRAGYDDYLKQTTEMLNKLPVKKFTPDLTLLEEIIRSLKVGSR